jgi:ectoine hydroxylase-related dioxygenase (phytanoyl-CoA dioxygenase family)
MEGWRPICGELAPGDLLIWDRHLVHYSEANQSEEDRVGLVMVLADAQYADEKARDILYL